MIVIYHQIKILINKKNLLIKLNGFPIKNKNKIKKLNGTQERKLKLKYIH